MLRNDPYTPREHRDRHRDYECPVCGHRQTAAADPRTCPECGGWMRDLGVPRE